MLDVTNTAIPTMFYAAYQAHNDRELQACVAQLVRAPQPALPATSRRRRRRIGLLSQYFCNHTIGRLNLGLVQQLPRDRFEVFVIAGRHCQDETARAFRTCADHCVELPSGVAKARQAVTDCEIDLLIFTDVEMDPLTDTLAFSKLAPVQCVTWGHPVTTGSPAMDYFISSELLETPAADQHYTERLVRLPNLAVCYERPRLTQRRTRESFGFCSRDHLYVCPQTLFKLHPEFDEVLAGVLRRDPRGLLVLIQGKYESWTRRLEGRFKRTMPDVANRIVFLPRLSRTDFFALCAAADVLLDPLHFGGGNTSYEGLALGTPIVTLPSPYLRGRITHSLYKMMDISEVVVGTRQQYAEMALRLTTDSGFATALRTRIERSSDVLFNDCRGIDQFANFCVEVIG